ncbi:hypothetical protein ACHWQZ_G014998 [Mnemiopsis leidyi]
MSSNLPDDYERILLVKPVVSVYKLPPRGANRGFRAADWKLEFPDWKGRMRIVTLGEKCIIRLEDSNNGKLFGECPIDDWPSVTAVEAVIDSSRYFVLRLVDPKDLSGRHAFIGVGFADRGDSFDFNVAISDHFKWLKQSKEIEKEDQNPKPAVDLSLKAGQTITINLKNTGSGERRGSEPKPRANTGGFTGFLPPPPSSLNTRVPPPGVKATSKQELGPLSRVGGTPMPHEVPAPSPVAFRQEPASDNLLDDDQWGSFSSSTNNSSNQSNWVSFS